MREEEMLAFPLRKNKNILKGTSVLQEGNGQTCHHDTYHRHQLDEDIERWTRGILERITHGDGKRESGCKR